MRPECIHVAVVGAGPIGLEAAAWCKHRGYQVTILERQPDIGGDWLRWGNPWSKLQSHRDGYIFSGPVAVPREDALPSYPTRQQMLEYFKSYAKSADIAGCVRCNCEVTGRTLLSDGKVRVLFRDESEGGGVSGSLEVTHIFAAPGRVNKRRELRVEGEASFAGAIAWGSGGDLSRCELAGRRVVVVGHGSFAVESARHALEQGAASVVMVARRRQVIMSRAVGFFVERNVHRSIPSTTVMGALKKAYELIGWTAEELEEVFFSPSSVMFPTSDLYFLAVAAGRLSVVVGAVEQLQEAFVEVSTGARLPADVFVKCVGFSQDAAFDAAIRADLKKGGRVANFHHSDRRLAQSARSYFAGGSGGARHVSPALTFICRAECLPTRDLLASANQLRARVAARARGRQSLHEFLQEQRAEWVEYCALLGADIPYPYDLEDLEGWDDSLAGAPELFDRRGEGGDSFATFEE